MPFVDTDSHLTTKLYIFYIICIALSDIVRAFDSLWAEKGMNDMFDAVCRNE